MKRSFAIPIALVFVLAVTVGACSSGYDDEYEGEFDDGEVPEQGPLGKADNANCNETELGKCLENGGSGSAWTRVAATLATTSGIASLETKKVLGILMMQSWVTASPELPEMARWGTPWASVTSVLFPLEHFFLCREPSWTLPPT